VKEKFGWLALVLPFLFIIVLVIPNIVLGKPDIVKIPKKIVWQQPVEKEKNNSFAKNKVLPEQIEKTNAPKVKKAIFVENTNGYQDGSYTGTARGYGGNITVGVEIKEGKIFNVTILSADKETPSFFNRAKVVVNRIVAQNSPNVDVVSGATYSSNGIIDAVINALNKAGGKESVTKNKKTILNPTRTPEAKKKSRETFSDDAVYADGSFVGTGEGWGGTIKVKVTIKKGTIKEITIISAKQETIEYFNKAKKILKNMKKFQTCEVDVISGATYSSNGIKDAVRQALQKSIEKQNRDTKKSTKKPKQTSTPGITAQPMMTEPPVVEKVEEDGSVVTICTEYGEEETEGNASCLPDDSLDFEEYSIGMVFKFLVKTVITTTDKDGIITTNQEKEYELLQADVSKDTKERTEKEGNWFYLKQAIFGDYNSAGVISQLQNGKTAEQVDVVSGATCSSWALLDAYKDAMLKMNEETP